MSKALINSYLPVKTIQLIHNELDRRYEVKEKIGKGSFGEIYKVID